MEMEPKSGHQASPYVLQLHSVDPVCYCHVGALCMHKVLYVRKAPDGAGDGLETAVDLMTATAILARTGSGKAAPFSASTSPSDPARPLDCCLRP